MGSHFIQETTQNLTPPVSYQTHPWPSSNWTIPQHSPASWQAMLPAAPAMVYPSDPYVTPVDLFIPPSPGPGRSPSPPPMQPLSPDILYRSTSTVSPRPPSSVPAPAPALPIHRGIICDMCDRVIEGVRHKCLDCTGMLKPWCSFEG